MSSGETMVPPPITLAHRDLVFFDIETTGLDPYSHEIVELALLRLSSDLQTIVGSYESKCIPEHPRRITPEALAVNGYDPIKWAVMKAISVRTALTSFDPWIDENVMLVGQNPHFDWEFLRETHRRQSLPLPRTKYLIDTASLAWPLVVAGKIERVGLDHVCDFFGVSNDGAHSAMVDVERTALVYACLLGLPAPLGGKLARRA